MVDWEAGVALTWKVGAAVPVPVSARVWGDPAALSAIDTLALKVAIEAGVKVTDRVQLEPAASDDPQVLVCVKLVAPAPAIVMALMVSGALPVLASCAVCAALVVPLIAVKVSVAGDSVAIGAGAMPVPTVTWAVPVALP